MEIGQTVVHATYGVGVVEGPASPPVPRYTKVHFKDQGVIALVHISTLTVPTVFYVAGDRVAFGERQGTVKSADSVQVHIAWDTGKESYLVPNQEGLTLLPALPAGTMVKRKGSCHIGQLLSTPHRGDTHVGVRWNSGETATVKLEMVAPLQPQKPQEAKRTVDSALAEIRTEISKWRTVEQEAEEKIRLLTEQATVLLDAKRHSELVQSIQKW